MSRSALWRQEDNLKERERRATQIFATAIEEGRHNNSLRGIIPLHCPDDTFHIHPMLLQNITSSPYFQKCCEKLMDWNMVVDEIYYEVKHMEPWTAGAHKSPSTAFCLLLRLFTLRCTEKQMTLMLNHVDSPYIRCIGFLYLRYAADPSTLWSWFEPYLHDEEPVQIRQGKADTTVGKFVHMLLSDLDYYGTRLPRLPLAMERQFKVKLLQAERVEERAKQHSANAAAMEYFQKTGARIQALYGDDENPVTWYDAIVDRVILRDSETGEMLARPKFQVTFPEYGNTEIVSLGEVDLPGSNSDSRSNLGAGERGRIGEGSYSRDDGRYDSRGNDPRASNRGHYDDRGNSRYDSRERFHHRERSRSRSRDREDNFNDARREEQELMEEVLRREREKTAAKGRAYAARPVSFKESIGSSGMESKYLEIDESWRSRGGNRERRDTKKDEREEARDSKPAAAPSVPKTAAELAAIEDKKRKLMARYG